MNLCAGKACQNLRKPPNTLPIQTSFASWGVDHPLCFSSESLETTKTPKPFGEPFEKPTARSPPRPLAAPAGALAAALAGALGGALAAAFAFGGAAGSALACALASALASALAAALAWPRGPFQRHASMCRMCLWSARVHKIGAKPCRKLGHHDHGSRFNISGPSRFNSQGCPCQD